MANAPYQRMKVANQTSAKNIVKRGSVKTTLNPVEEKSPVGPYAVRFQIEKEKISCNYFKFFSHRISAFGSLYFRRLRKRNIRDHHESPIWLNQLKNKKSLSQPVQTQSFYH